MWHLFIVHILLFFLPGIVIHFKGEAAVEWSETETRTKPSTPAATTTSTGNEGSAASTGVGSSIQNVTVNYSSHEQYFENKFNLLGGSSKYDLLFV
jgi:hypothetical protein